MLWKYSDLDGYTVAFHKPECLCRKRYSSPVLRCISTVASTPHHSPTLTSITTFFCKVEKYFRHHRLYSLYLTPVINVSEFSCLVCMGGVPAWCRRMSVCVSYVGARLMASNRHINPLGATRQTGFRGTLKQTTLLRLKKSSTQLSIESPLEVLLARLADLSTAVTLIDYQPFTVDVPNERVLLNHFDLQVHRQKLREMGISGAFYTPDLRFRWKTPKGVLVDEIIEAKDANWIPSLGDEYTDKLLHTRKLLAVQGIQFGLYAARVKDLYSWALVSNVNKLHALMLRRTDALGTLSPDYLQYLEHREAMLSFVQLNPSTSFESLATHFNVTVWATWHLLIDEHVSTDLWCAAMGPNTTIVDAGNAPDEPKLFRRIMLGMRNTAWEVLCKSR